MDNEEQLSKLRGDKKMKLSVLIKRALSYSKGVRWMIAISLILTILLVVGDVLLPLIMKEFTDSLSEQRITTTLWSYVLGLVLGYFALGIFSQVVRYFQSIFLVKAGQVVVMGLRNEVFAHIENMSQNQFNEMPVGSLVTRVANYTSSMSDLFSDVLVNLLTNLLKIITVFIVMCFLNVKVSLILLAFVGLTGFASFIFWKNVGKVFRKERQYVSDMNAFLSENLSGMKIIQIFSKEESKKNEFKVKNDAIYKIGMKVVIFFTTYMPFTHFIYLAAEATSIYASVIFGLSVGTIVSFNLYLSRFFHPIQEIANQLNQIQRSLTGCERLFNLLDVAPEVVDEPDAIEIDHFNGKIEFRNVWFAYEGENWILKDVSFIVNPKETVAFVGATGAGKTTILSLIVRNYKIQKGQILIDDIDISKIKVKSLRKAIGQMLQDVFLFSGTIKSNITLRDDSFSDEEIIESCKYVNADKFIEKLPHQYDEQVIERGENFSTGQRQLLSFARTVLHKPQVLILDEATANIDTETEVLIQESLLKMKNIGTMLVVAHRLSTVQHADNIIVLQNGEILEQGRHQTLLKKKGYYYKLYKLQYEER